LITFRLAGFPRPSFVTGGFFGGKNVDGLYSRATQRQTISGLVGSYDLALKYIEETSDVFLGKQSVRGHGQSIDNISCSPRTSRCKGRLHLWIATKGDVLLCECCAAGKEILYFVVIHPLTFSIQWQKFNALNWVAVEDGSRLLAADRNINLDVYSGTFGTMSLADTAGSMKEIFLYVSGTTRQIPVPKLYYKLLINKADSSGIVLLGVNNPHLTLEAIKKDYVICTDVSSQVTYINWQKDNIERGFSYACEVNDFLKAVPHISGITVSKLLV